MGVRYPVGTRYTVHVKAMNSRNSTELSESASPYSVGFKAQRDGFVVSFASL